eukprot:1146234-Pelagomonas_calceolata.AAC.5
MPHHVVSHRPPMCAPKKRSPAAFRHKQDCSTCSLFRCWTCLLSLPTMLLSQTGKYPGRSPDPILMAGVEKKMPSIGGSQRVALFLMHAAKRQA